MVELPSPGPQLLDVSRLFSFEPLVRRSEGLSPRADSLRYTTFPLLLLLGVEPESKVYAPYADAYPQVTPARDVSALAWKF